MKVETLHPILREEAERELASGDRDRMSTALVRLALHDPDRAWLERLFVQFMAHEDDWVRGVAALCVGHVARLHRTLDLKAVLPSLHRLLEDPATAGRAQDALDDIDIFIRRKRD